MSQADYLSSIPSSLRASFGVDAPAPEGRFTPGERLALLGTARRLEKIVLDDDLPDADLRMEAQRAIFELRVPRDPRRVIAAVIIDIDWAVRHFLAGRRQYRIDRQRFLDILEEAALDLRELTGQLAGDAA